MGTICEGAAGGAPATGGLVSGPRPAASNGSVVDCCRPMPGNNRDSPRGASSPDCARAVAGATSAAMRHAVRNRRLSFKMNSFSSRPRFASQNPFRETPSTIVTQRPAAGAARHQVPLASSMCLLAGACPPVRAPTARTLLPRDPGTGQDVFFKVRVELQNVPAVTDCCLIRSSPSTWLPARPRRAWGAQCRNRLRRTAHRASADRRKRTFTRSRGQPAPVAQNERTTWLREPLDWKGRSEAVNY